MDPAHEILFEPVRIGPLTTKNRFFAVPHCNGMGYRDPSAQAAMRRVKAEGGWSVVCTEEVEIDPTCDLTPYIELRIWDERDLPALERICTAIHEGGALAGIELCHGGLHAPNLASREVPLGPCSLPVASASRAPVQAREMTRADIAQLRRRHRLAVRRAVQVGYDLVYVYAAHGISVLQQFLSPRFNQRTDEYGGCARARMRLLREVLLDSLEEAGGRAAIACRLSVDEGVGPAGLGRRDAQEILGELGELPDLWDLVAGELEEDCRSARFAPSGDQEPAVAGLKRLTSKPVVGVGRFSSPDLMADQVRRGVLDLVGAARPSIADPFLPAKIRAGRADRIAECVGCNECLAGDNTMSPIRCPQNPTIGEEFRRGWHPQVIRSAPTGSRVLVVGAGPAGLEAARALGARGVEVLLAEAGEEPGGRVAREAALPGLGAWSAVVTHRVRAIEELPRVEIRCGREVSAADVGDVGHVLIATGSRWRRDAVGRRHTRPIPVAAAMEVLTPDDLMDGRRPAGRRVVVYDDDHCYLGGVLAELLAGQGHRVQVVTPAPEVSAWTAHTGEIADIQRRLIDAGVARRVSESVVSIEDDHVVTECAYSGRLRRRRCDAVVLVTARLPEDRLARELGGVPGSPPVRVIGDALAPGTITAAVWSGRRAAEEFDAGEAPAGTGTPRGDGTRYRREVTALAAWESPDPDRG